MKKENTVDREKLLDIFLTKRANRKIQLTDLMNNATEVNKLNIG